MKKFPRFLTILLCCLLLGSAMVACNRSSSQSSSSSSRSQIPAGSVMGPNGRPIKEEVIIGVQENPLSLDPHFSTSVGSRRVTSMIYERLVFLNAFTGEIQPAIAESWDIDGAEITFHLRRDVRFHDGKQLTSADVKYSLERMKTMSGVASYVAVLDRVDSLDDYTVKVTLTAPSPSFLTNLTTMMTAIIPEGSGDTIAANPIGCGPYKFAEWRQDDYLILERFDDFFGGAKPTPRIRFRIIPDHSARILALEARDIDQATSVQMAGDYTMLENRNDITLYKTPLSTLEHFGFEVTKPPFDDIHARRAVAHAINKDAYIQGIFNGEYTNLSSILLPGMIGFKEVDYCEYNPAKAREELARSAYPNGFSFAVASTATRSIYIESVQYDLAQVGITMTFDIVANVGNYCSGGFTGGYINSISSPELEPGILYNFLHSRGGQNYPRYSNPRVDALFEAGAVEMDPQRRAALYGEISDIIAAEVPWIPMHAGVHIEGANSRMMGVESHPSGISYFYNVYYEYD